jgi:hypothetical protein
MLQRLLKLLPLTLTLGGLAFSQWVNVSATKDDWEEINFEFDSHILTDGFPSLLRLAELLSENPDYRIRVVGHTDFIGSAQYNDRLAMRRANAVKAFLEKYGARPDQVIAEGRGKAEPKLSEKTDEARFVNRRVELIVTDGQGRVVGAGGVGDVIKLLEQIAKKQEECCDAILKKLDKLDDILAAINSLRQENEKLRGDLESLRAAQEGLKKEVAEVPKAPPVSEAQIARISEEAARKAIGPQFPKFSIVGANIGADDSGNVFFSGRGRFFAPFWEKLAIQAEAEYMGWRDRKEGQFDFGIVGRHEAFQLGLFSSFKHVTLSEYASGGTLGQGSLTADYIFSRGRVGLFGAKGFMNKSLIDTRFISRNLIENVYISTVDQVGLSGTVATWGRAWAEGNIGYLRGRVAPNRAGGTLRLVMPFHSHWAFTAEGGVNETLLSPQTYGRFAVGVQFGNFLEPKRYAEVSHPVPADIPRLRYEIIKERIRTGNDAPVANAGPDLIGIPAGTVTLDGSASYDPDGDPITFRWIQVAGPPVAISGATSAIATFNAADGQVYGFRLEVTDSQGLKGVDSVSITVKEAPRVRIISFSATPPQIAVGGSATLNWNVENADEVVISGIGSVDKQTGTRVVSPAQTTVYTLTARNAVSEANASVIVVVERPDPSFIRCFVTPANVIEGESASISWETKYADSVMLSGVGPVPVTGNQAVTPLQNTTYTLTATNAIGSTSCQLTVQVTRGAVPRIISFSASPLEILAGSTSNLSWQVENAQTVTISGIGQVNPRAGTAPVAPTATTQYVLTASNGFGAVSAAVTVEVLQPARVTSFTVAPTEVAANQPFRLSWTTENATQVVISEALGTRPLSGSVTLYVPVDTTYTIVASNRLSTDTATVTIRITQPPPVQNRPPVANAGSDFETLSFEVALDGSTSNDPDGDTLTFSWRVIGQPATLIGANTAQPRVQFTAPGTYEFELTVTDPHGASATDTVRVTYRGL